VNDTGTGMSEEMKAEAFKPFTTSGNSQYKNVQGVGLGLSIVK